MLFLCCHCHSVCSNFGILSFDTLLFSLPSLLSLTCHDLKVAIAASIVQWHQATLVLGVNISTVGEQQLYNPGPVVARSQVQRRRLPPVARVAVHIERRQQGKKFLLVPTSK